MRPTLIAIAIAALAAIPGTTNPSTDAPGNNPCLLCAAAADDTIRPATPAPPRPAAAAAAPDQPHKILARLRPGKRPEARPRLLGRHRQRHPIRDWIKARRARKTIPPPP